MLQTLWQVKSHADNSFRFFFIIMVVFFISNFNFPRDDIRTDASGTAMKGTWHVVVLRLHVATGMT